MARTLRGSSNREWALLEQSLRLHGDKLTLAVLTLLDRPALDAAPILCPTPAARNAFEEAFAKDIADSPCDSRALDRILDVGRALRKQLHYQVSRGLGGGRVCRRAGAHKRSG